ncbi:diguanylate cyclase (GGDEF)-like protein/PAS domain S-box-containing protein [Nakamurella sp. UYEF19]|uniref:GGDEF domain-containing protein n=1 Tax=Nakamurella sp. UYEF19 TaxID=1756392 RepID=UPI003395EB92
MVDSTGTERLAGTGPPPERQHGPSGIDVRSVRTSAVGLSVLLICLVPLTLPEIDGFWRLPVGAALGVGVLILLWCAWLLRPGAKSPSMVPGDTGDAGGRTPGDRPTCSTAEVDPAMDRHWRRCFTEVFDTSPVGVALFDEHCIFVRVNPALAELLGRPAGELIGHGPGEFGHSDDVGQVDDILRRMAESVAAGGDGIIRAERRWVRPDGELRTGALSVSPVPGPEGRRWMLSHVQDLTERKQVESVLQQSQATLTAVARVARCVQSGEDPRQVLAAEVRWLAQAISVCILEPAEAGRLTVSHCVGHRVLGTRLRPGTGAPGRIWLSHQPELIDEAGPDDWGFGSVTAPTATATSWWQPLLDNGTVVAVLAVTWDRVLSGAADPSVLAVQLLAEEAGSVLTAARVRMELETLAETDAPTGLENRRGWQSSLQELISWTQQTGEPLTLALVDLDHLKRYNDTYGHHEGDELLRNFAARARAMLRKADVIARWGGEEFSIGLPGCAAGDAAPLLDRLRVLVPDSQTCSIGYATLLPTESASQCLVRADAMLYRAKREGRNRVIGSPDVAQQTSADG